MQNTRPESVNVATGTIKISEGEIYTVEKIIVHERYDGNGYPTGARGDDIPRSGQLSALCDVYCALIMDRAYRKAISHTEAIRLMTEEAGKGAFNPQLFQQFVEIVNEQKMA